MERRKALTAGIIGGGIGGITGVVIGNSYGQAMGYNPWLIALLTGIFSIAAALLLAKIIK